MKKPTYVNLSGMSALVADGSEGFISIIAGMLREFGVSPVQRAVTGERALQMLNSQQIDLAFIDCFLPGIDGFALTRELRSKAGANQMITVMIMTGHAQHSNVIRARDEGANMVIAKPISAMGLYDRLAWASENPRDFVICDAYIGPDRRHKIEGYPGGGRREMDVKVAVDEQKKPDLSQSEIDTNSN